MPVDRNLALSQRADCIQWEPATHFMALIQATALHLVMGRLGPLVIEGEGRLRRPPNTQTRLLAWGRARPRTQRCVLGLWPGTSRLLRAETTVHEAILEVRGARRGASSRSWQCPRVLAGAHAFFRDHHGGREPVWVAEGP